MHTQRHADAILPVNGKAPLDHVDNLTIVWDGDRSRRIDCPSNVVLVDRVTDNSNYAPAVYRGDMGSRQTDQGRVDF
jgi:hypothetical protein